MQIMNALCDGIDRFTDAFGRALSWLIVFMVLATAVVVLLRYGFEVGSIALQESVTYMHATVFLLGAACTLKNDGHVRVDIFYRNFSRRTKAWVNSVGAIVFLIPLSVFIVGMSWSFVANSWAVREISAEPGGIPAVFLLKSLIPLMAINLLLQSVAELIRESRVLIATPHHS